VGLCHRSTSGADPKGLEEIERKLSDSSFSLNGKPVALAYHLCCAESWTCTRCVTTPNDFRKLALSLPETEERAHMNHPDFRVAGKIFATLGYPNREQGMVKVTPVEQEMLMRAEPSVFSPETGAWGRQGCTRVNLKAARETTIRRALAAAWHLAAPESLSQQFPTKAATSSVKAPKSKVAQASRKKTRRSPKLQKPG
jgi:hypothetical protein